jgi:hypothetical protein
MCESTERQSFNEEVYAKACRELEKLRLENSKLGEEVLELRDELLSYTGLAGEMLRSISRLRSSNLCWPALPMRWRTEPS